MGLEPPSTEPDGADMKTQGLPPHRVIPAMPSPPVDSPKGNSRQGLAFGRIMKVAALNHRLCQSPELSVGQALQHLNNNARSVNERLENLLSGDPLSNSRLLSLQGMMLNFNRELTAVSKIVEQFVNGIKTTLNTRV